MSSAFAELGVCDEIVQGLDKIGWALPTDIQAEAVPLILGGGDVLMAAETGSGKTGAFCLPVIQIVNESKREKEPKDRPSRTPAGAVTCKLSMEERSDIVAVSPDGLQMQCRDFRIWGGCRSTWATKENAVAFYEVSCNDEGLSRFGFGTISCDLNLGTCPQGFGFGGTGKKSNRRQFDSYGEPFGQGDIIGCLIDRQRNEITFFKNGKNLGVAFQIPNSMSKEPLYAICCLKNAEVAVNFDGPFKFPPKSANITAFGKLDSTVRFAAGAGPSVQTGNTKGLPMAIILEPSRELAQQTEQCIEDFSQYIPSPSVSSVCLVGGGDSRYQKQLIEEGVDIVVGTPGRLEDFINSGVLKLDNVRFLIVDECDALLAQNQNRLIENIHRKCPQISPEGRRLQMVVCSATLHNFNVKKLAQKLMSFPTWVDLKGEDSVPDTVHHCVALVDPSEDRSWFDLHINKKGIITDKVHQADQISPPGKNSSEESISEGIKKLKGEYVVKIIKKHKMEKAIIFCRTKLDCDNLERLFIKNYGGGPYSKNSDFSCVCLHSDRKPNERKSNLERFKKDEVRFLICTDVAARGIDVKGVPYVINVTMPDDKANYLHRIGRVGRADCMGLAISLVAKQREKVWYHSNCRTRGNGCFNTNDVKQGGCTIWYNEMALLGEVEDHLKDTIEHIDPKTMSVPVNEFDGKVVYGRKNIEGSNNILTGHYRELLPTLNELKRLEKCAQGSFIELLKSGKNIFS